MHAFQSDMNGHPVGIAIRELFRPWNINGVG